MLFIGPAVTSVGFSNFLSVISYRLNLWMKGFRSGIVFNNFIHGEKLFHAIIDFLVSFTVTLPISDLLTL